MVYGATVSAMTSFECWCAGDLDLGSSSCGGDSGGPISCKKSNGSFYLAGVNSFGFSDCMKPGHARIFTRMTQFEEWAKSTIQKDLSDI